MFLYLTDFYRMNNLKMKNALLALSVSLFASTIYAAPSAELQNRMKAMGTVQNHQVIDGGLTAWTISSKSGKVAVFYTTPDEKVLIKGDLWKTADRKNISDDINLKALNYASPEFKQRVLGKATQMTMASATQANQPTQQNYTAEIVGKFNGPVPEIIKLLDQAAGYKEGKGNATDTLYLFYDPRCKWCHQAYYETRKYVNKGFTIKWLPTLALGQSESGYRMAASILQSPKADTLEKIFNRDASYQVDPTPKSRKNIDTNLEHLLALVAGFDGKGARVSVPTGFYVNKRTGKIKKVDAISESVNLEMVFGK